MVSRRGFLGILATLPFVKDLPLVTSDESEIHFDTENTELYDYQQQIITDFENNKHYAFLPEAWAAESLAILTENMVAANLVHRDNDCRIK